MNFDKHSNLSGSHAFLGASNYHWLNYDEDKLRQAFLSHAAVKRGTELHAFAAEAIRLKIKLKRNKETLNMYVNDAIGFDMTPEQILYFSENCYGTADAIHFSEAKSFLRIHDLKTGKTPAKMEQLYIYAALFCLEYDYRPGEIEMETRIYQNNDYWAENPTADIIAPIMSKIKSYDKIIRRLKEQI